MQLRATSAEIGGFCSMSVVQDGCTVPLPAARAGRLSLSGFGHASAERLGRLWSSIVAAARRGAARVVEHRHQEALRLIRRVKAQCDCAAGPTTPYEKRIHLAGMAEVERYLSQSSDLCELEWRIREVERRGSQPGWF